MAQIGSCEWWAARGRVQWHTATSSDVEGCRWRAVAGEEARDKAGVSCLKRLALLKVLRLDPKSCERKCQPEVEPCAWLGACLAERRAWQRQYLRLTSDTPDSRVTVILRGDCICEYSGTGLGVTRRRSHLRRSIRAPYPPPPCRTPRCNSGKTRSSRRRPSSPSSRSSGNCDGKLLPRDSLSAGVPPMYAPSTTPAIAD